MSKKFILCLSLVWAVSLVASNALAGDYSCPATGIVTQTSSSSGHSFNKGCDIADKSGPMVGAARSGKVVRRQWQSGYGNTVDIQHSNPVRVTRYAHLASYSVNLNQYVSINQNVGKMGNTGVSTGVHLHWEVRPKSDFVQNIYSINLRLNQQVTRGQIVSATD